MFIGKFQADLIYPIAFADKQKEDIICDQIKAIYKDELITVYYWGILYNRKELGYSDSSQSDAEIIASLYMKNSWHSFGKLDGTFTFVIYAPDDMMMIVRDHHGTNSQVYYNNRYFSSSLSLLQQTDGFQNIPDYNALSSFLNIGYIATPQSAIKGVNKLPAGSILMIHNGKQEIKSLFPVENIEPVLSGRSLEEYSEEYGYLHAEAIRRRIGSSRNVGILLSGGYDSGCNLAALRKIYDGDIRSFSIGFKGDNWTELPLAKCMSDTFHTIHREYEIDGSEVSALPQIVEYLGDPFVEGGLMVNYAAMRMIGEDKPDVILGGDGSDQYFGTSGRELSLYYFLNKYNLMPLLNVFSKLMNCNFLETHAQTYRIRFQLNSILQVITGNSFGFSHSQLKELRKDGNVIKRDFSYHMSVQDFEHLYTQHLYNIDINQVIDQVILFKASRMAGMFGNDISFPYMDNALYQFLMELPVKYKLKGKLSEIAKGHGVGKYLLKYHYKPYLPEAITARKKQGGFAPMPLFFKDLGQRNRIADFIMNSSVVYDFLDRNKVEQFINTYDKEINKTNLWFWYQQSKAIQYFNLLVLALWWEIYINRKKGLII